jgi:hypothetical protein
VGLAIGACATYLSGDIADPLIEKPLTGFIA